MNRFIKDTRKYWLYAKYAAKSELKSEVASSHLNWLWWILDPLLFMLIYSFVSIVVFGKSEQYFAAFVFIGITCWDFFSRTVKQSVKLVSGNSSVVTKIYLPKYILIYIQMLINGFKMLISFCLVLGIMVLYRVPVSFRLLYMIPLFLTLFLVTFGISAIMLHGGVFIEDLYNVVNALLRFVFYMSGIFYSIPKRVPGIYGRLLLKVNPVAMVINGLRDAMLYSSIPDLKALFLWMAGGLFLSVLGVTIIYKSENTYVKVI
ncbi:MAG TPA: polysaccharide ABC transporter [Lachnospiraceae bacterium]|nr:polysaccharide ABC transporter [Lachnospiraceae bacterium]